MDIAELLAFSVKNKASDLHLSAGLPPMWAPAVLVVMGVAYSLSAYPAGVLSARVHRLDVLLPGLALLLPAHLVLADPARRVVVARTQTAAKSRNNPYHVLDLPDPVELTVWAGGVTGRRGAS